MDLKDPKTQKLMLVGLGTAVLVYFYVFADYVPFNYKQRSKEISALKADYTKESNELTKAQQLVNRLPELKKEFALLNQKWSVAQELLPTQKEVAKLQPHFGNGKSDEQVLTDIFWALLNSKEFIFNH